MRTNENTTEEKVDFSVGVEDCSAKIGFCNGPLAPNTGYM